MKESQPCELDVECEIEIPNTDQPKSEVSYVTSW